MPKPTGFLEFERKAAHKRDVRLRTLDYQEVEGAPDHEAATKQATRCMDCGTPFCHQGCPLGNIIPEFNDAVYQQNWKLAYEILTSTNNFPEFTGRICPAPCETSCVLGINKDPVSIEYIEKSIIERAFMEGYVTPKIPVFRSGKKVAIVGSGPAGLAAAAQLNQAGHHVVVFERDDEVGGLLRYGIPDFKLDKEVVIRRMKLLEAEGILFKTNSHVGVNVPASQLQEEYDVILLCGGSTVPRDLDIPGRKLHGIHFAMDFLVQQNRRISGKSIPVADILATGKNVVVLGGGDTGSDCVGTSNRQGAASITQLEILEKPPTGRSPSTPWPQWPLMLRTSTSHEEGCQREWSIVSKEFIGDDKGQVSGLKIVDVEWKSHENGKPSLVEREGSDRVIPCELVLLSLGFLHPQHQGLLNQLGVECDERGNVKCKRYQTSKEGIFSAGDMRRGQSLVVWAISEGREAARAVDEYLMGDSNLERKEAGKLTVAGT